MTKIEKLNVAGAEFEGICIGAPGGEGHPNMLVITGKKGYIMCGYLNIETAEKFGDVACIISGADFNEMLANPVKAVTSEGEKLGIAEGMTGEQVCEKLV